jgi:hypothetical protein
MNTSPLASPLLISPLGSHFATSRKRSVYGSHLELWAQLCVNSNPVSGGTWVSRNDDFVFGSTSPVVANLLAQSYTVPSSYNFHTQSIIADEIETPSLPLGWDTYGYILPLLGGLSGQFSLAPPFYPWADMVNAIWGGSVPPVPSFISGGPLDGLSKMWLYWPLWRGGTNPYPDGQAWWQNASCALRGRYRIDGPAPCFEATCALWVQHLDGSNWVDGWETPNLPDYPKCVIQNEYGVRFWPKNFQFVRKVTPAIFTGGIGSTDTTSAFNYIGSETGFEPDSSGGDINDGFVGNLMFQAFEDKAAWQVRTGWTLS